MFRTLPAMTPGYLHPAVPVASSATLPRLSELSHRKLPNGAESDLQGSELSSVLRRHLCLPSGRHVCGKA